MVMATSYQTHDQSKQQRSDKPQDASGNRREWLDILLIVLFAVVLFVGVGWLASLVPESTGNPDLQYWLMP
jgi:hypothetical protein